jgi:hypothetical protein
MAVTGSMTVVKDIAIRRVTHDGWIRHNMKVMSLGDLIKRAADNRETYYNFSLLFLYYILSNYSTKNERLLIKIPNIASQVVFETPYGTI